MNWQTVMPKTSYVTRPPCKNSDLSEGSSFFRMLQYNPLLCVSGKNPKETYQQTRTTISRASAAVSSFLCKMLCDTGYTRARRIRLALQQDSRYRLCKVLRKIPNTCLCQCLPFTASTSFSTFCEDINPVEARLWMSSLSSSEVCV